jgi:hypothetical protein
MFYRSEHGVYYHGNGTVSTGFENYFPVHGGRSGLSVVLELERNMDILKNSIDSYVTL